MFFRAWDNISKPSHQPQNLCPHADWPNTEYVWQFLFRNRGHSAGSILPYRWYPGNNFVLIENENFPNETFVKIDGNRQILIHIIDEKNVRAQLLDLRYKYPNLVN